MSSFKTNIIFGAIWSIIGQFGYVGVVLVTNIILSRILSPYIFGQIGIVMFFIILFNVLVEGGMGGALIRKKEATNLDYTTVFLFNLVISTVIFLILVLFSGVIAHYYKDIALKNILIVSGLLLIINSFQLVHNIKLTRELQFKKKAFYSLISIVFSSSIGVCMAYYGFGVWSMVIIQLLNAALIAILLWTFEGNFGPLLFSKDSFRELIKFGANTTVALMINTAFENIYQLVLGRYFSINQVGLFYQAKRLMDMPTALVAGTGSSVIYASISKLQDDRERFIYTFNKILFTYAVAIGLVTTMVFVYAENIILILYGNKWIGATYYMKLLCIVTFFFSINVINELIFKVFDQTKRILHIMIIRNSIQAITIIVGVWMLNLDVLIYGFVFTTLISFLFYFYFSRKILNSYSTIEMFNLLKIVAIAISIIVSVSFLANTMHLKGMITFIFVPFIILIYIFGIQYLKILDLFGEIQSLLKKR
ncbi:MAG: lipopolysaccharide biosynthesis protein [Flavobacterium sp.]